jgi:hypothetical protein
MTTTVLMTRTTTPVTWTNVARVAPRVMPAQCPLTRAWPRSCSLRPRASFPACASPTRRRRGERNVCVCVVCCVCVCLCVCVYICVYLCACVYIYVCAWLCVCVYICRSIYGCVVCGACICIYVCVCLCIQYIYMYICVCAFVFLFGCLRTPLLCCLWHLKKTYYIFISCASQRANAGLPLLA